MHKAFKYRIYPTKEQATLIHKTIGCSRFVFNHFLAEWNEAIWANEKRTNLSHLCESVNPTEKRTGMVKRSGLHLTAKCIKTSGQCIQTLF